MSYKQCFFAVPATTPMDQVLAQFSEMGQELRDENGYDGVFLVANEVGGLRLLWLAVTPPPRGEVSRDFFTERWDGGPLFVVIYDDQHGIYLWQQTGRDACGILTDGHRVGLRNITPSVDYTQQGFTPAELDAAFQKPEEQLTPREARALMEPTDAITIGLGHFGFKATRGDFLKLLDARTAWSLLDSPPREKPRPPDAGSIVSFYIEPYQWSAYKLPDRHY